MNDIIAPKFKKKSTQNDANKMANTNIELLFASFACIYCLV